MYCSKQDLIDRYSESELIELTDRIGLSTINDDVLNQAISDASVEMNLYIQRFNFDLANFPAVLKPLACDITRYRLYDEQASEQVNKRYLAAIKTLQAISKGEISIGSDSTGEDIVSNDFAEIESSESVFSRKNSSGFI